MIANPDKFQAIVLKKNGADNSNIPLQINGETTKSGNEVVLLGVTTDDKLSFTSHMSDLCKSAANQLNSIKKNISTKVLK